MMLANTRFLVKCAKFKNYTSMSIHAKAQKSDLSELGNEEILSNTNLGLHTIILNRPSALNALNQNMVRKMTSLLFEAQKNSTCKAVLVKSSSKSFCAGGDVKDIALKGRDNKQSSETRNFFKEEYRLNHLIGSLRMPYIAFMDGVTMGGGAGISVHGRFRIATENTVFAMPEANIGLLPDVGSSFFLSRLDGHLGTFLALTGYRLKAQDVFHAGIATHYIPSSRFQQLEYNLPSAVETSDIYALSRFLDDYSGDRQSFSLSSHRELIDRCFSRATVEGIIESLHAENSPFAKEILEKLERMSPTSLKVTLKCIRLGKTKSFRECLTQEFRCVQHMLNGHDLYEGVRAVLIDKDSHLKRPNWQPSTLNEVKTDMVAKHFAKQGSDLSFFTSDDFTEYRTIVGLPDDVRILHYVMPRKSTVESVLKTAITGLSYNNRIPLPVTHIPLGFVDKVRDILNRYCITLPDGTLDFKDGVHIQDSV